MIKDKELRLALKIVLSAAAVVIFLLVIIRLAPIITIFIIALFAVYLVAPLVNFLISKKFKPMLAAVCAALIILVVTALFFYFLVPGVIGELRNLTQFVSTDFLDNLAHMVEHLEEIDERFNLQLTESVTDYFTEFSREFPVHAQQMLRHLSTFSMAILTRIWVVLGLAFLVFYLVQDLEKAKKNLTLLFPRIYHERIGRILGIIDEKVGAYIRGTLMKSLLVGVLTGLGLSLMGMPFGLMLGILAGLLNIILYIGPVMAAIPALLLSLAPDTPNFFLVLALYLVVQILDGFVFTPVLLGKAVDISPLTVVAVVLIGGQLMGITGIILAIPIAAILKVLLVHYFPERDAAPE